MKLYTALAQLLMVGNFDAAQELAKEHMPSGSGFDCGTTLDPRSTARMLVFCTEFHHMHELGHYDGWTEHQVTVVPSFICELDMDVSGRDKCGIKDYIHEVFYNSLMEDVEWPIAKQVPLAHLHCR